MLPTNRRVKKEAFPKIMKEGLLLSTENFYARLLDRKDNKSSLFSFVVPAKVKKTSVGRHLIKRRMTAAVEKSLITQKLGFSIIIFAKKDISTLPSSQLKIELGRLLGYTL